MKELKEKLIKKVIEVSKEGEDVGGKLETLVKYIVFNKQGDVRVLPYWETYATPVLLDDEDYIKIYNHNALDIEEATKIVEYNLYI